LEGSAHKGYCLATMVDALSAVLSGANWGPFAVPFAINVQVKESEQVGKGIGHFFGAWDIEGFRDLHSFKASMDAWIVEMRKTPSLDPENPVLIPGDPERIAYQERKRNGIPLNHRVENSLHRLSKETGIPLGSSM
jgi:L-2-hydroxycarboxylate dehydrogenase (NAD+)